MGRKILAGVALAAAVLLSFGVSFASAAGVPVEIGKGKAANFEPVSACGCHTALVEQWSKSMHAQALNDPLYVAKLEEAEKALPALGVFCRKCHAPAAMMIGEAQKPQPSAGVAGGVTCAFCHQVTGDSGAIANTSQLLTLDGTRRAQLKDPQAPHKAAFSEFHDKAEICGGCHNVDHPINGMHLESTYSEWKKSPYAEEGVTCQDCHMSSQPGVIGPSTGSAAPGAPERTNIFKMTFIGANVEFGDSTAASKLLQTAATVEIESPQVLDGAPADIAVTVKNTGAGHYLPTGLTEVREMWLEVYAEAPDGTKTPIGERRFGTILEDAKGRAPVELWEAVKIKSDDRIAPRGSVTEKYSYSMPDGAEAATVKAVLRYRSAGDELAKKAGAQNPVTDMAVAEAPVFASEAAMRNAARVDVNQGRVRDGMNLVYAVLGLVIMIGLVVFFGMRSRG